LGCGRWQCRVSVVFSTPKGVSESIMRGFING
jgi:hypothetical protein